jgi:hypothetical protein
MAQPEQKTSMTRTDARHWARLAIIITVLGVFLRLALSCISWGSNDITTWFDFGHSIADHGLLQIYSSDPAYNHPPIPGIWSGIAYRLARVMQPDLARVPPRGTYQFPSFAFIFKLAPIAADAVCCWLLWRIARARWGARHAVAAVTLYALNPVAILVSAHHGNTDSIYAMLCLAAVYFMQDRSAFFLAGLTLGAAINVKLIPSLLIPPLASTCRDWRQLTHFLGGLAIAAIPFVPVMLLQWRGFRTQALNYGSYPCDWGISLFFLTTARMPKFSAVVGDMFNRYVEVARLILLAAIALFTMWAWRHRDDPRVDHYKIAAATVALFMILTPGFGLQYAIAILPLLAAVSLSRAALYSLLAGLMLLFTYWLMWEGDVPMVTFGGGSPRGPAPAYGLLAWAVLISFVWWVIRSPNRQKTTAGPRQAP